MKRFQIRLVLLAGFLLVFPFFIRRRRRVEKRITIFAPPAAIFPLIEDLRNWPVWTEWGHRDTLTYSHGEQSVGTGAVQKWRGRGKSGELRIVRSHPDERMDYELEMDGCARVFGRILLFKDGACTRVVWRCVWEPSRDPYRRYLDLLMQLMIGRDFNAGLKRLKSIAESN